LVIFPRGDSRRVMARSGVQKLVGYSHNTPAPWPDGNCFFAVPTTMLGWYSSRFQNTWWGNRFLSRFGNHPALDGGFLVVNMHAENFHAAIQKLKLKTVEIEKLDDRFCLVVDRRIPKEWLLATPKTCCAPMAMRERLWRERPECFRQEADLQSLFGKTWLNIDLGQFLFGKPWVHTDRGDTAGLMARLLPGDRIRFDPAELICTTASGEVVARRYWEPHERGSSAAAYISVYDMREQGFSGIGMRLDRVGDTLTLTPSTILGGNDVGGRWEVVPETEEGRPFQVRYRMESAGEE
jgi:hypothetical protein